MAGTLSEMKARVARDIARSDFPSSSGDIANAITDAITFCQKMRFRFSETAYEVVPQFTTLDSLVYYSIPNPGFVSIDYVLASVAGVPYHLSREQPELVLLKAGLQTGTPEMFAVEGERILLGPAPPAGVVVAFHGHIFVAAPPTDDATGNRWMIDGERMIRYLAKANIYRQILRNTAMADEMSATFMGERDALLSEAGKLLLFQGQQMRQLRVPEAP